MAAITTRSTAGTGATVAGVPLTNAQLDTNFINLNTAVVDAAANTAVTAGAYTNTNLTVDARGRITAAANGSPGGVTAVTGTAPVVSSGGTTPAISIPVATTSASGYLSSTDWTTFNNKAPTASPTFTGTLAAAAITASTTLGVTGVSTLTGGATVNGPLIIGWNTSATYPTSGGYGVLGWNFSGGSAEVNSWNAYVGAVVSFNWKQKTGTSAATDLMQLSPTGVLTTTGGAVIQGLTIGKGIGGYSTNTALGVSTLNTAGVSQYNTAVGYQTLVNNSTGSFNTGVGGSVFTGYSTGSYNSALGYQALTSITSGTSNIGIGYFAGYSIDTGSNNTIIGSVAGTAGLSNTVIIAAGSTERMRIDSSGVTGFYNTVSVGKSGAVDIGYSFGVNSVSAAAVGFNNSGSTNAYGAATSTTYFGMAQGFPIVFTTSAAERMRIGSTGAVSIPGTLAVAGDLSIAAYTETVVPITLTSGGAVGTLLITAGTVLTATLTAGVPCTFAMPTGVAGKSFTLMLKQPATGTVTTATFTNVKWAGSGAPTITATLGKMDILTFVADGTNWYGSYTQGYTP